MRGVPTPVTPRSAPVMPVSRRPAWVCTPCLDAPALAERVRRKSPQDCTMGTSVI